VAAASSWLVCATAAFRSRPIAPSDSHLRPIAPSDSQLRPIFARGHSHLQVRRRPAVPRSALSPARHTGSLRWYGALLCVHQARARARAQDGAIVFDERASESCAAAALTLDDFFRADLPQARPDPECLMDRWMDRSRLDVVLVH
jgi:hypothetical protein